MPHTEFAHVETWVFDLDNTLYPPEVRLFDQIEARMVAFMTRHLGVDAGTANRLRQDYWRVYGTTLAGLMDQHQIAPEPFLEDVHAISFDDLSPDPALAQAITDLGGRAIVYTNGTADYARQVLAARGLSDVFEAVYGVEDAGFVPKPQTQAFERVFARDGLATRRAAMFEDDPRNLSAPFAMGMRTVHVAPEPEAAPHIDHHTDDLADFLSRLVP